MYDVMIFASASGMKSLKSVKNSDSPEKRFVGKHRFLADLGLFKGVSENFTLSLKAAE